MGYVPTGLKTTVYIGAYRWLPAGDPGRRAWQAAFPTMASHGYAVGAPAPPLRDDAAMRMAGARMADLPTDLAASRKEAEYARSGFKEESQLAVQLPYMDLPLTWVNDGMHMDKNCGNLSSAMPSSAFLFSLLDVFRRVCLRLMA